MRAFIWSDTREVVVTEAPDAVVKAAADGCRFWLQLLEPDEDCFKLLSTAFCFHPLSIEDARSYSEVPKIEIFKDYIFVTIHGIEIDEKLSITIPEVDLFLGANYVVTVETRSVKLVQDVIARYMANPDLVRRGVDLIAHEILDSVVDAYFPALDVIEMHIAEIEEKVSNGHTDDETVVDISETRRALHRYRRTAGPAREVFSRLSLQEVPYISDKAALFFKDIYDHVIRAYELAETQREILASVYEIYLSAVSNRMNRSMQRLTAISTIFLPLTFIVGVYGMNFHYMPELEAKYGYFILMGIMLFVGMWLYRYFKRQQWL